MDLRDALAAFTKNYNATLMSEACQNDMACKMTADQFDSEQFIVNTDFQTLVSPTHNWTLKLIRLYKAVSFLINFKVNDRRRTSENLTQFIKFAMELLYRADWFMAPTLHFDNSPLYWSPDAIWHELYSLSLAPEILYESFIVSLHLTSVCSDNYFHSRPTYPNSKIPWTSFWPKIYLEKPTSCCQILIPSWMFLKVRMIVNLRCPWVWLEG